MTVIAGPLPTTSLPPGDGAIKPNVEIPVGSNQMLVKIIKVGWPGNGEKVGDFILSYAVAGGTPIQIMKADVWDVPEDGNVCIFADTIPDALNGHRKLILSWNLLVGRSVSGTIEANVTAKK